MSLKKFKTGSNMYDWISHGICHLGGECSHHCQYCYVDNARFGRAEKFTGPIKLIESEFKINFGEGKTIFVEYQNDLFAKDVPVEWIRRVINHCNEWPKNTYVFQSKNPARFTEVDLPPNSILGCTIETNRIINGISEAPIPEERYLAMKKLSKGTKTFLTLEPILQFDVDILAKWIYEINPTFLNLGADSKSHNLPEPTVSDIMALVAKLKEYGIDLREKHNLQRLMPK